MFVRSLLLLALRNMLLKNAPIFGRILSIQGQYFILIWLSLFVIFYNKVDKS
ncbi:hypothetical protein ES332_A09G142800v1 [Gossypium tomentosum]|uniref:Uncharacterized protein n=1 Tax=Gossypium tomentosum TaxID=34277 RepID=A0A5D2P3R7_GOSTO|nr:hypothetical protein ES332_A09G142800v1 [Gossypium tomentosum]